MTVPSTAIRSPARSALRPSVFALLSFLLTALVLPPFAMATAMMNDPRGYRGIPWGASLLNNANYAVYRPGTTITDYRPIQGPPRYADQDVDSIMLSTIDDQFARVTIRYRGEETHKQILGHLEQTYGRVERIPGQMTRGLNQQYNWRGPETEINLTYEGHQERGYLFIESRTLAPRFNDGLTDSSD